MARLHASFVAFYAPDAQVYAPLEAVALPACVGDVLRLQAPLVHVNLVADDYADIQLGICRHDGSTWVLVQPNALPIEIETTVARVYINRLATASLPALAPGCYHLCLHLGAQIQAVSNALQWLPAPGYTRLLRYRNHSSDLFFNYTSFPDFYNQLRLPLRIDRPRYVHTQRQAEGWDGQPRPLYQRVHKHYQLETDYLNAHLLEALQLALQHDVVQVYNEADASWDTLLLTEALRLHWQDSVHCKLAQATGQLQLASFSAVNGYFANPSGDFAHDYTNDFTL